MKIKKAWEQAKRRFFGLPGATQLGWTRTLVEDASKLESEMAGLSDEELTAWRLDALQRFPEGLQDALEAKEALDLSTRVRPGPDSGT